jgi:hypothetical protein
MTGSAPLDPAIPPQPESFSLIELFRQAIDGLIPQSDVLERALDRMERQA